MLNDILLRISETGYASLVRDTLWGYPIFETIHTIGIIMMFGSIALVDLRYIGFARILSAYELGERHLLRFTWVGFALIALSGLSLFSAYPVENIDNIAFKAKFVLIALAGLNMLFFNFRVASGLATIPARGGAMAVENAPDVPLAGRISVGLSLCLWAATIACGRLIAYPEIFE